MKGALSIFRKWNSRSFFKTTVSLAFFGLCFWFWAFLSHGTLRFHENAQFFPYTWTHVREALGYPGGIAVYISEFFVQFFLYAVPGGLVMAGACLLLHRLVWSLSLAACRREDGSVTAYVLCFIPSFCAWAFMCVFGDMFTGIVSLCMVLSYSLIMLKSRVPALVAALSAALMYAIAGPMATIGLSVYLAAVLFRLDRRGILGAAAGLLISLASPYIWQYFVQYTLRELIIGIEYCHQPETYTTAFYILALSPLATLIVSSAALKVNLWTDIQSGGLRALKPVVSVMVAVLVFGCGWVYVIRNCDPQYERIYEYDKMACAQDWDGILDKASKVPVRSLAEGTAVDLALAMKGMLLSDMFRYSQAGPSMLIPDYAAGYVVSLTAGESAFRAGLLNTARHYAFEEYESYPNFKISSRFMKRLAEIDLLNGNYEVAERFLTELSHTLFYRKWADTYLQDPTAITADPEYARLAACRDTSDYLYSDSSDDDKRLMLRRLAERSGGWSVAHEYLLAYDLLARDLWSLREDVRLCRFDGGIPVLVQQAMAMFDNAFDDVTDMERALVMPDVKSSFADFQIALTEGKPGSWIESNFGRTYWYYYSRKKT